MLRTLMRFLVVLGLVGAMSVQPVPVVQGEEPVVFIVNHAGDADDADPSDGVCLTGGGVCTLRAALTQANGVPYAEINFNLAGTGPFYIRPMNVLLPAINTASIKNPLEQPVILDGTFMLNQLDAKGLVITSTLNPVSIEGLQIQNFKYSAIYIDGNDVTIGGALPRQRNFIVNNRYNLVDFPNKPASGIYISSGKKNISIIGNYIGVDTCGTTAQPNDRGISIWSASTGASIIISGNLISGNLEWGVAIYSSANIGSLITGNKIGVKENGQSSLPNGSGGIRILDSSGITIEDNQIAGNTYYGLLVESSSEITVRRNLMSCSADQALEIKNSSLDIKLDSSEGMLIGGENPVDRNVLLQGISIYSGTGHQLVNNLIGTTETGVTRATSDGKGVSLSLTQGHLIKSNAVTHFDKGIVLASTSGSGNRISQNAIWDITTLGIDLADDGITSNDPLDADSGPNGRQNFPVITSVVLREETGSIYLDIFGTLNSKASNHYIIELFSGRRCHASGYGEGQDYLASVNTTTDSGGNANWSVTGIPYSPRVEYIGLCFSATATEVASLSTSEFSAGVLQGLEYFLPLIEK